MSWRVRYARTARDDLRRLYAFMLEYDADAARRAIDLIDKGLDVLRTFPFACRKIDPDNPYLARDAGVVRRIRLCGALRN